MTATGTRLLRRWESRGGKYWVELSEDKWGYSYTGSGSGGCFRHDGLPDFLARIERGDFQADANTTPMREVTK